MHSLCSSIQKHVRTTRVGIGFAPFSTYGRSLACICGLYNVTSGQSARAVSGRIVSGRAAPFMSNVFLLSSQSSKGCCHIIEKDGKRAWGSFRKGERCPNRIGLARWSRTRCASSKADRSIEEEERGKDDAAVEKSKELYDLNHESELTLIIVACGIGLLTGSGVVVFNDAIHIIRDFIWEGETILNGRQLLREFTELELWPKLVIPPVLAGAFVSTLGSIMGGYQEGEDDANRRSISASRLNRTAEASTANPTSGPPLEPSKPCIRRIPDDSAPHFTISQVFRPIARAVAAAVTLGSGVSLGPEGPSVDIGLSCAKGLSSTLSSGKHHLTSLLAAGSGAGVAAGFNAPIAGVFFAVETVLQRQMFRRSFEKESNDVQDNGPDPSGGLTIAMVLLASVLAAVVSQAGLGSSPAFRVPEYRLQSFFELPLYLGFGAICGVVSATFSYSSKVATDAFTDLREGPLRGLLPALGGLTTGVLALGYPEILYQGFDNVNSVLVSSGEYAPGLLLQIVLLKIIATSMSKGSGLQGGIYAPSIFIGAALGSAFGLLAHAVCDPLGILLSAPQAFALVGVAAMLSSTCSVPLTSVLLLFELTRDYLIIVPTLAAVGISFWTSSLISPGLISKEKSFVVPGSRSGIFNARQWPVGMLSVCDSPVAPNGDGNRKDDLLNDVANNAPLASSDAIPRAGISVIEDQSSVAEGGSTGNLATEMTGNIDFADEYLVVNQDLALRDALELMEAQKQHVAVILNEQNREVRGFIGRTTDALLSEKGRGKTMPRKNMKSKP